MSVLRTRLKFSTSEAEYEMSPLDRHLGSGSISSTPFPFPWLQPTLDTESLVAITARPAASSMQHAIGEIALWS
ncbi:hypothetical protein N7467_008033 [Penicillium canescens]|nr:hypothetical protein N7467_008033 [Penicillium canescens]